MRNKHYTFIPKGLKTIMRHVRYEKKAKILPEKGECYCVLLESTIT